MKLRPAPNSLFAVLLRSPWWISLVLGLAWLGAALALLPPAYRVVGAVGALPLLVISAIALWRQLRAPSAGRSAQILAALQVMTWPEFSAALQQAYTRAGYTVTPGTGATDLVLRRDGRTTLVAARRWKAARVGEDALQALHAAVRAADAGEGILISLGELSPNASRLAARHGLQVPPAAALALLLKDLPSDR